MATTVTAPVDDTLRALDGLSSLIEQGGNHEVEGAQPCGIHLEGPFISHGKRGIHPAQLLQTPSVELFNRFWQASRGSVKLLTIAPELPGALDLIRHAASLGVRISLGHSDATASETHAGNRCGRPALRPTPSTPCAGLAIGNQAWWARLLDAEELFAEIICDGVHLDPSIVRLFAKAKSATRGILVTDGISATGMPDGSYMLGGLEVEVADGRCMYQGALAGSVLTLDRAVRNFANFTGAELPTALRLATRNPAELLGIAGSHGSLAPGTRADVTVLSSGGEVLATFLGGKPQSI